MREFPRRQRLPPYVFNITGELKTAARRRGGGRVCCALIENEERIRQAIRGIKDMFGKDGLLQ